MKWLLSELRRRRVPQVVIVYLVVGFGILQGAEIALPRLGLPDWTVTFLLVLILVGLPVAIGLAWAYDLTGEGVQRSPPAGVPMPDLPRRPGWLVPATLLTLALLGVLGFLSLRRSPDPSLDADLLAVLPARVAGADASLGYLREGVVDLVGAKLGGDGTLRALDSRTLLRAWRDAGGGADDLVPVQARAIARDLGAGKLLLTEAVGPPQRLTLTATLLGTENGAELGRDQVVGSVDSLDALVEGLIIRVLALEAGEAHRRIPELTRSLPALRAYLTGRVQYRAGHHEEAVKAFHEALQHDSTFALAALAFEESVGWTFVLRDYRETARRIAWRHRNELTLRDRMYLEALVGPGYPDRDGTLAQWVQLSERALKQAPERPELWSWYADVLIHYGTPGGIPDAVARGREAMKRALELDPQFSGPIEHLADLAAAAGDTAELRRITAAYLAALPEGDAEGEVATEIRWLRHMVVGDPPPIPPDSFGMTEGDLSVLSSTYYKTLLTGADPRLVRNAMQRYDERATAVDRPFLGQRFMLALLEGRLRDAGELLRELETDREDILPFRAYLLLDRLHDGAGEDEVRIAAEAVQADWDARAGAGRNPVTALIGLCALGQWQAVTEPELGPRAADRIEELLPSLPESHRRLARTCAATLEAVAAAERQAPGAAEALARADALVRDGPLDPQSLIPSLNLMIARLHEDRGDHDAARAAIRRADRPYSDPLTLQVQLREMGRLSTLAGDRHSALRAYRRYLSLRPEPDPAAAHTDAQVRREMERMTGEAWLRRELDEDRR